jgi:arylsulfatase A-like enzyme
MPITSIHIHNHLTASMLRWGLGTLFAVAAISSFAAEAPKPNILIILADDLGYSDVGFQGATDIPTPNLNSLAASGVVCTEGYVSSPVCSPTRAGLLTGRNGVRFGYEFNNDQARNRTYGIPLTEKTLADRLRTAGYRTGVIGKWHLGELPEFVPTKRGFDYWHGHIAGGHDYISYDINGDPGSFTGPLLEGAAGNRVGFTGHLTAHFGTKAVQFVTKKPGQPWFLYLSFNAPHTPLQPASEDLAAVQHIADPDRRSYAGLIVGLDRAVGRVLDALRQTNQTERTMVFFLSDNGGAINKTRRDPVTQKPIPAPPYVDNSPFSGFKDTLLEGGVHVPFVVSWPGRIAPRVTDEIMWSLDISATALAAAGVPAPDDADGVDLLPFLLDPTSTPPRSEVFVRYRVLDPQKPGHMLRVGPLKLLNQQGVVKLFDVVADPSESTDLAAALPDDVARLNARWAELKQGFVPPLWPPAPRK